MHAQSISPFNCLASSPTVASPLWVTPLLQLEQHNLSSLHVRSFEMADDFICVYLSKMCRVRGMLDGEPFHVTMGQRQMHLIGRGEQGEGELEDRAELILITLSHGLVEQIRRDIAQPPESRLVNQIQLNDPFISTTCSSLLTEFAQDRPSRFYIESLALALGAHIVRHYSTIISPDEIEEGSLSPQQLYIVREYVESNLAEELSLETLAAQINFSPYYFSRLFKEAMGTSPYAYIVQRRIEAAKRLLQTTQLPIEQIAASVGYGSPSHFSRTFKRYTETTPREYRRFHRQTAS